MKNGYIKLHIENEYDVGKYIIHKQKYIFI